MPVLSREAARIPIQSVPHRTSASPSREVRPNWGNQVMQRLLRAREIQAKLTVNEPGDVYEQEADRIAESVMRMSNPGLRAPAAPFAGRPSVQSVQRMCTECEEEELHRKETEEEEEGTEEIKTRALPGHTPEITHGVQEKIEALRGGGSPLPTSTRSFFEPRFGADFRSVRAHTDARAAELARTVQARAFTRGHDIVFGAGEYAPMTREGQRLLAHELTHTLQQGGAAGSSRPAESLQRAASSELPGLEPLSGPATPETAQEPDSSSGALIFPPVQPTPEVSFAFPDQQLPAEEEATVSRKAAGQSSWSDSPEREAAAETPYATGMSEEALESALGRGRPLPESVRSGLESRHGQSLGHVRLHTDSAASDLSAKFSAQAFAFRQHIAFGEGTYRPDSPAGQRLLRHEVAHVLQPQPTTPAIFRTPVCTSNCPPGSAPAFVPVSDTTFNCYSYALNSPASGFLFPGNRAGTAEATTVNAVVANAAATRATLGRILPYFTPAGVRRNTEADIGTPLSSDCTRCCSGTQRKIIAVATNSAAGFAPVLSGLTFQFWQPMVSASERWDFHWYRKDADRAWSHKRGGNNAQRDDASGTTPICNPCNANRNHGPNYQNVIGSWCV